MVEQPWSMFQLAPVMISTH